MDDKQIVELLRNGSFSQLGFLSDDKLLGANDNYYGFLYFLLDKKRESTSDVLKKIELKYKSLSCAYEYLGRIACKVFSRIGEERISLSFFGAAVDLDSNNSDAWFGIYSQARDNKAFLNSLVIDFKNNQFDKVKNNLICFDMGFSKIHDFSKEEYNSIVEIIFDEKVSCKSECPFLLISAYYSFEDYNKGIYIINNMDYVGIDIIQFYYDKGLIDLDLAISKIASFQLDQLLKDDHERIYIEYLKEAKEEKLNPTISFLIMRAFRALKYSDVIEHYKNAKNALFIGSMESHLYYLISQLYLNIQIDETVLGYVREHKDKFINDREQQVLKVFNFKYCLYKLEKQYLKNGYEHSQIYNRSEYKPVDKLLKDKSLLDHYLYDELSKELDLLSVKWNTSHFKYRLNSILTTNSYNTSYDDLIKLCTLWIENSNYDGAIDKIKTFHKKTTPTIVTSNLLGVCFERKGMFTEAFEQYEESLNLMLKHKEYNSYVFSNYLSCAEKNLIKIPEEKYNEIRDLFNISLAETFKLGINTTAYINKLFKYYPFNLNTLDSLFNQYFYLPSKNQLNDPIEMPDLDKIGCDHTIDSNYRICSFSNNSNSMLMWSHYTENHQGIMVEYQFCGGFPVGVGIDKVKYINESKRNRDVDKYIFNQFLLTKNQEWSYEEEVRLISYKEDKIFYENYDYPNHNRSKINAEVSSITLGCKFDESKKALIVNLIKNINDKRKNYEPKVKLRKALISESNLFRLDYVDIDI